MKTSDSPLLYSLADKFTCTPDIISFTPMNVPRVGGLLFGPPYPNLGKTWRIGSNRGSLRIGVMYGINQEKTLETATNSEINVLKLRFLCEVGNSLKSYFKGGTIRESCPELAV